MQMNWLATLPEGGKFGLIAHRHFATGVVRRCVNEFETIWFHFISPCCHCFTTNNNNQAQCHCGLLYPVRSQIIVGINENRDMPAVMNAWFVAWRIDPLTELWLRGELEATLAPAPLPPNLPQVELAAAQKTGNCMLSNFYSVRKRDTVYGERAVGISSIIDEPVNVFR